MILDKANLTCRVLAHITPCRADQRLAKKLNKLQDLIEELQRSSEANPQSRPSHTEAALAQCAREVIVKGAAMYEASLAARPVAVGQGAANRNVRDAEWVRVSSLKSISWDQRRSEPSDTVPNVPSELSGDEEYTVVTSATSVQHAVQESEAVDAVSDESDDDLDNDLAKAALDTGTKAFEAQEWDEANSLLQEALQVLQQLPKQRRAFCDIFDLHYKLAVCAYHTQEPADAEEALTCLSQQSASTDKQREYVYKAAHLLSYLYIRMGQVERARSQCEKALQARRRLLGKQSDGSLESTALMSYIYVLLNNLGRARSYLAMIPEARRDAVLKVVENSLDLKVEHLDSPLVLTRSMSEGLDLVVKRRLSASFLGLPMGDRCHGPVSATILQSPAASLRQSQQRIMSNRVSSEDLQSVTGKPLASAEERSESRAIEKEVAYEDYSTYPEVLAAAASSSDEFPEAIGTFTGKTLSRKEIIDKIGCQPKDGIEDAVCDGDHEAFAILLSSKKDFWRSKFRKRVRPERVTALHFAALFGEIDMAQRLLDSSFNINEVPYGYTTSLTPLKFAIGARQVEMVDFLISNGAKPSQPDSWSSLAGQLMNRSWLMKTMSEAEKEHAPNRIIAILRILLKYGWDVNTPFETSGGTVLHQAVTLWTGSYKWDLNLRTVMTSFLCEQGADPFQANKEGETPYSMASASGHQDLLIVLDRGSKKK